MSKPKPYIEAWDWDHRPEGMRWLNRCAVHGGMEITTHPDTTAALRPEPGSREIAHGSYVELGQTIAAWMLSSPPGKWRLTRDSWSGDHEAEEAIVTAFVRNGGGSVATMTAGERVAAMVRFRPLAKAILSELHAAGMKLAEIDSKETGRD